MNAKEFNSLVEKCTNTIQEMLGASKADEYNLNKNNRFDTFYKAAAISGETPEQALFGFWLKHLVSITDMVSKSAEQKFTKERWQEKIIDSCNYGLLLLGLLEDQDKFLSED